MTIAELKKYCEENNIPDDTEILESLYAGSLVDIEYDSTALALFLIFD